jgi:hypothetical protein
MPLPESLSSIDLQPFLDNPEQLIAESKELQLAIANYLPTPRHLLEILTRSSDLQVTQTAKLHVNWAGEIAGNWQETLDEELQNARLGHNDRLAVELLKFAPVPDCFFSEWVPPERFIQGLRNPYLPLRYRLKLLERLAKEPTIEPRLQVAESPETPLAVLEELAGDLEIPIRLAVRYNSNCPTDLIQLVEGQHTLASNWNTEAEQLTALGQSRWGWIRLAVAQNPATPPETLMQLAGDLALKIQLAIAKNPQTPANVLAVLAEHPDKKIQETVAEHPNATEEILHQLFPTQQDIFWRLQNLPTSILERLFRAEVTDEPIWKQTDLRYLLLEQPNTPTWILAQLADVDIEEVKADKLAKRVASTSLEVVEGWVRDAIRFLADIAKHPQVTLEILDRLSEYPSPDVQLAVAQNYLTPEDLKTVLLEEVSVNPDSRARVKVAEDPNTPVPVLEAMARNEFYHTKLLREIRRVLASEYAANADSFESVADPFISFIKHEILYPANITVDVDRWMETIQNSGVLEKLATALTYGQGIKERDFDRAMPLWTELLPGLSAEQMRRMIVNLSEALNIVNCDVKNSSNYRSLAVALVGNPNTPITLREFLKNQLIRPSRSLQAHENDCPLFLALAYNPAIPEAERREYLQQVITSGIGGNLVARDPRTPTDILEQLLEQGEIEAIAKNPAVSESLLRRIADLPLLSDWVLRTIAENPNTPPDLLVRFVEHPHEKPADSNISMLDLVLKNPNLPSLEGYRLLLGKEQEKENAKAREFMSRRPNSPFALAEVLKSGDKQALYNAARNFLTPVSILEQLAKHPDESVRRVLLDNTNLPLAIRLELTRDPSISVRGQLAYKHYSLETPVQVLEILANDESEAVRAQVAANPDTPIYILSQLGRDSSAEVGRALTGNPNTPEAVLEFLGTEKGIVNSYNSKTPGKALAAAVERTRQIDFRFRDKALDDLLKSRNSQMPASVLEQLASYTTSWVRSSVAFHHNTPTSVLVRLAYDDYAPVRAGVAQNPNTRQESLMVLLTREKERYLDQNYYYTICHHIAGRSQLPADVLEELARNDREQIRGMVAHRADLPQGAIEWLVEHETNQSVLLGLLRNGNLTVNLLDKLAQKQNPQIRVAVLRHPNLTVELSEQLARDEDVEVRCAIASSSKCPASILLSLASDSDEDVRQKVAANPNTPANALEFLSQDLDAKVRVAIASNPNTITSILEQLAQDEKVEVRRAAAKNPQTPATIRESLRDLIMPPYTRQSSPTLRGLSRIYNSETDDLPTLLSEYVQSSNHFVRFVSLMHPLTPVDSIAPHTQSLFWSDRCAIANNPSTPVEIRQQLALDSNRIVRAAAKSYLQNL